MTSLLGNAGVVVKGRFLLRTIPGVLLLMSLVTASISATPPQLQAHFIDVGQGDSCWISLPNGDDVLVDGGKSQAGASVVAYLQERGVDDIELMVATHSDTDHVAGMLGAQATMRPIPGTLGAPHCSHAPSSLSHASLIRARLTHSWHGSLSTRGHATCTRRADRHRYVAYSERLLTGRALEWSGWTVQMDGRSRSVCSPASRE